MPKQISRGSKAAPLTALALVGAIALTACGNRTVLTTALDAGISPETLRKIETGRIATPAFPTVAAVAGVLGVSLDALWAKVCDHPAHPAQSTRDDDERLVS